MLPPPGWDLLLQVRERARTKEYLWPAVKTMADEQPRIPARGNRFTHLECFLDCGEYRRSGYTRGTSGLAISP